ncbi:hypothetical protein AAG906_019999 [Vitis piasezkii]
MTILHGSTRLLGRAEGCVPSEDFIPTRGCICGPLELPWSRLDGYHIEYIWALLLCTCQLIPTESHSYCTLSSVSIFVRGFTLTDLDSPLCIRVREQRDMDSQIVTVDQFAIAMASIQEAIANFGQMIDGQQTQQVLVQESAQFNTTIPPPPSPSQSVPQAIPFTLHSQTEIAPSPVTLPIPTLEDPHTCTDRLEQRLRQMRASDRVITWEEFDGAPVASLPAKFRMLEIERYTGIGYPRIHLRLYSTVMRAHRLDEAQMVMLFLCPRVVRLALVRFIGYITSRTWDDLAQESLVQALYGIEEGIARGLWPSLPILILREETFGGEIGDVGAINSTNRHHMNQSLLLDILMFDGF